MKKLILAAIMVGVSMNINAQGTVDFRNNDGATVNAPVFFPDGTTRLTGPNYVAQLFFSGTSGTESSLTAIPDVPAPFRPPGGGAGYWNAGGSAARALPGVTAGSSAFIQVRVWDSTIFGPTGYATASTTAGATVGKSTIFSMATGGSGTPPSLPTAMTGLTSFSTTVVPVPEPSTIALGVLGAVFFLMRKRK